MTIDPIFWNVDDQGERSHYRMRNIVGRARLVMIDDKGPAQLHQVELYPGEVRNAVQRLGHDRFGMVPLPGAGAIILWQGGNRGFGSVVGIEDARYRARGYKGGEAHMTIVDGAKGDGTGGTLRAILEGLLGWIAKLSGKTILIGTKDDTGTITLSAKDKILLQAPQLVFDGECHLGGTDANIPASMRGTVDSRGDVDVSGFATKVFLK